MAAPPQRRSLQRGADVRSRLRASVDRATSALVRVGGTFVIVAIALIFFYLLWVVWPLFGAGSGTPHGSFASDATVLHVGVDENSEVGFRFTSDGLEFFSLSGGTPLGRQPLPAGLRGVVTAETSPERFLLRYDAGRYLVVDVAFTVSFAGQVRSVTPAATLVHGAEPFAVAGLPELAVVAFSSSERRFVIAGADAGGRPHVASFTNPDQTAPLATPDDVRELPADHAVSFVAFGPRDQWLYLGDDAGHVTLVDVTRPTRPRAVMSQSLLEPAAGRLTAVTPLLGRQSLLLADSSGRVTQWTLAREAGTFAMHASRSFTLPAAALLLVAEPRRKGFVAVGADGHVTGLHTTSQRRTFAFPLAAPPVSVALSPRGDLLLAAVGGGGSGAVEVHALHNEHPEVSLAALWGRVWYEGYAEPLFVWQSSSSGNEFEPKFSLTPLAFGTIKAAVYAMLMALPLAVLGAIYTAYFMSPRLRDWIKPGIEIMAALPTVILGFLAGLWLAPIVEQNLLAVLLLTALLPLTAIATGLGFRLLPESWQRITAWGWHPLVALGPILGVSWLVFAWGPAVETAWFGGNLQAFLRETFGIDYEQRNALVVGLMMGLAVIPVVFSIAEDAIYGVPRHLVRGSLALGATPWQTLSRVVLLTASPGIFSAAMIGLGRAVGETMIVLMATGNTAIMDINLFEGMRTFAANIAVELPESEVDSTHYRLLFLAALVLFGITFLVNTAAEIVRQRLRARYGNL
jgi:phosphate transport system permease protein